MPLMGLVTALVSKSCTTLSASSFEDVSSVSGSHSLSEAMYLASLSLLRLICSEHNYTPFLLSKKTIDRRLEGAEGIAFPYEPCFRTDRQHSLYINHAGFVKGFGVLFFFFCLSNLVLSSLRVRGIEEKRLTSLSILLFHYAWGTPFGGNAERFKRHPSASSGLRWSLTIWDSFGVAHLNRPVARFCISLSSGISMFARER